MTELKGILIPCDYLTQTLDGKWVIGGTFNKITHHGPGEIIIPSLQLYLRMETERARQVTVSLRIMDKERSPLDNSPPLLALDGVLDIQPIQVPFWEGKIPTPTFTIACNLDRTKGVPVNAFYDIEIWEDTRIAYCPLQLVFMPIPPSV